MLNPQAVGTGAVRGSKAFFHFFSIASICGEIALNFASAKLGARQKLLSGFFPLRGGGTPPIPLRVFRQDDFP